MASNTDNFMKASSSLGIARTAKLKNIKTLEANSIICDDLSGWPTDTAVAFTIASVNSNGEPIEGTVTDWIGVVNNNTIMEMVLTSGTNQEYDTLNTIVACNFTSEWANRLIDSLLKFFNQNGELKPKVISGNAIADKSISADKIAPGAVDEDKIKNNSVTGDKIGAGAVKLTHLQSEVEVRLNKSYSITEQIVGKWINGKDIYRKTFNLGALPNNSEKVIAHNLGAFDRIIGIYGIAQSANKMQIVPLPYVNITQLGYSIAVSINNTSIVVETKYDRSNMTGYLTVEYTKP